MENIYDNEGFFQDYAQMSRSRQGLAGAGEWRQLEKLFPDLRGAAVLDLGCGYGWHCQYAADHGASEVLGIDASGRMIEEAQRRCAHPRIRYEVLGLEDYGYPPDTFDLVVSNLVTIHLKTGIGRLSAYCGATSAGCGAGAGIAYLHGGGTREIAHTIVNAVAINSGMICDGAKASCAAKIASAVEAGLLGWQMQRHGSQFYGGDGIIVKGVENTIKNVGRLAREGMAGTDREIISIMVEGC